MISQHPNELKGIKMLDLPAEYQLVKEEILNVVTQVMTLGQYIGGKEVDLFAEEMCQYLGVKFAIPCGNGTDALQISCMALGLKAGDEVIVPSFSYAATAEVLCLLGLVPVMADVNADTFNISIESLIKNIGPKTRAIIPVHLFGQAAPMEAILEVARTNHLYIIEDNAQSLGASIGFSDGQIKKLGTIGHFGITSFFPTKNLGAMGDGGMMFTNDEELARKAKMIANHGQSIKYHHELIGCNSRLDTIQAAILRVKLKSLGKNIERRKELAGIYNAAFENIADLETPITSPNNDHTYHQYTIKLRPEIRNNVKLGLEKKNIESMVYYPKPLYDQPAFIKYSPTNKCITSEYLCQSVLSLPIHPMMNSDDPRTVVSAIRSILSC